MSGQAAIQTQTVAKPIAAPVMGGVLQRQCACGQHTGSGGECEECKKKRQGILQRAAVNNSPTYHDSRWIRTYPPVVGAIQTKLAINQPGDEYEQEADRIANQVLAAPVLHALSGASPRIQRFSGQSNVQMDAAPPSVEQALASPGRPLGPALRQDMEQRFGHDFSRVRVHTDAKAAESARVLDALAYTVGRDVVFSEGYYTPHLRQGSQLLAHELAHVIQQERGGVSPPPLRGGMLGDAADTAASAFVTGRGQIHVGGASVPRLACQLQPGRGLDKPRSLTINLIKDEQNLDDAALMQEIKLIQEWLKVHPSGPESDHLRSELKLLEDEELERMERREVEGQGPKEGSIAKLTSMVHRGRLEVQHGFSPGYDHCFLTKGTMEWRLGPSEPAEGKANKRRMQIKFTPKPSFANKTITFLQTLQETEKGRHPSEMATIDIGQHGAFAPFYGMYWVDDPKMKKWMPEGVLPEEARRGYKNQPSSTTDPAAYLYDEPWVYPNQGRIFESVAVVPETSETLGGLTWGVGEVPEGAKRVECSDKTSAYFQLAVEKFYATPRRLESKVGEENYDVILDGFNANDATLTADQEKRLDPIVTKVRGNSKLIVQVGGFAGAMDSDPIVTSEHRAQAVAGYLIGKGVAKNSIFSTGFGASWARYPLSMKEGRNRRVQIRLVEKKND